MSTQAQSVPVTAPLQLGWNQKDVEKDHGLKDHLFLPHTGIDLPFLKKRIHFIKDAPDFDLIQP